MKIHPLLEAEKQARARRYERERRLLGLAGTALTAALLLAFFYSGVSVRLASLFGASGSEAGPGLLARQAAAGSAGAVFPFFGPFIWTFLIYGIVFLAWMTVPGLPLGYYAEFVIERKWGFSTQTLRGWLSDQVKGFAVGLVLGWLGLGLIIWVMVRFGALWWLAAGLGMALVSVVLASLAPVVIFPLFHRYKPISDETLTRGLADILDREGLKSGGFFEEDMSRRTRKENAFLAGLGRTRRVVLGDTLIRNMSAQEITAIVAHEVGHFRYRHIWKGIAAGTAEQLVVFFAVDGVMRAAFATAFLASPRANLALVPMMALVGGTTAGVVFGPLRHALSRRFEKRADLYAVAHVPDGRAFVTALAGLANRNLANAYPARWVKLLYYSHPPIGERLAYAEERLAVSVFAQANVNINK